MEPWMWIVIGLAVVAALVAGAVTAVRARRRARAESRTADLRQRFGGEYQRAVGTRGRDGEEDLEARAERFAAMATQDLDDDDRRGLHASWQRMQALFVDDPTLAVVRASRLVVDVLERRGFPAERLDDRAMAAALLHPELADRYRRAHATYIDIEAGRGDPPDEAACRRAFLDHRALFTALLDPDLPADPVAPAPGPGAKADGQSAAPAMTSRSSSP